MNLKNRSAEFPIIFIAIDGKGGAGKSTLASQLSEVLEAGVIHTDDFTTFDKPAYRGSDLVIEKVFNPIIEGQRNLSYERLQVWPGEPHFVQDQAVTDVMLIEGCGVSCEKFRPYLSYVITVDLDDDIRIKRIIERDVVVGGRSSEENDRVGKLWEAGEIEYFSNDNPLSRSDMVVDSTDRYDTKQIMIKLSKI
jgi:Ni2+-binding GTPase involved in maturation of urease and hydrogenase